MTDDVTNAQVRDWVGGLSTGQAEAPLPGRLGARWGTMWKALHRVQCDHDGPDPVWLLWLHVPRGWWRLRVSRYAERYYVSFGDEAQFSIDETGKTISGVSLRYDEDRAFLTWLAGRVPREVAVMLRDPVAYRRDIRRRLPLRHRLGLVKRRFVWEALSAAYRPDRELGAKKLREFERLVGRPPAEKTHDTLTLEQYLSACAIAWGAVGYAQWIRPGMSPREQYKAMADGRDEGLLSVPAGSAAALVTWAEGGRRGGHPFEICRGGNSTHITLGFFRHAGGWQLYLEGGSTGRMVETARMALALDRAGVPFVLRRGEEMVHKLKGEDDLGVVPEMYRGGYAAQLFPEGERVFDACTIRDLADGWRSIRPHVRWMPVQVTCEPARSSAS